MYNIIFFSFFILFIGNILGIILNIFFNNILKENYFYRIFSFFWSGVLLYFVCFNFLNNIFYNLNIIFFIVFVFSGVIYSVLYENYENKFIGKFIQTFIFGIILSSLFLSESKNFLVILILTSIYFLILSINNNKFFIIYYINYIIIIIFSFSIGIYLNLNYNIFTQFIFTFSGGAILYIICQNIIPEQVYCYYHFFQYIIFIIGFLSSYVIFYVL